MNDITSGIPHWNLARDCLFNDRRSILPLWLHPGTCKLCTSSSASFAYMAHLGYHHIVSIAPYLSNFAGRTIEYTLETF